MGTKIKETTVKTLRDFIALVKKIDKEWDKKSPGNCDIWFRGVADEAFELVPSLVWSELTGYEDSLVIDFRNAYLASYHERLDSNWELYSLMRHYGLKTRLLDWTRSAQMGLFFALYDRNSGDTDVPIACQNKDAAVWVMDPVTLNQLALGEACIFAVGLGGKVTDSYLPKPLKPAELRETPIPCKPIAMEAPWVNPRIIAQSGVFTVHGTERYPVSYYFEKSNDKNVHSRLHKIIIPSAYKKSIFEELRVLGLTEYAVFQDLDTLCMELNRMYRAAVRAGKGDSRGQRH